MSFFQKFDPIIKRIAWISLAVSGISVTCLVVNFFMESRSHKSRFDQDYIQFIVKLDGAVQSASGIKLVINNSFENATVSRDSVSGLIVAARIKDGFRPTGVIDAKMYAIHGSAFELRIDYQEGFNSKTDYAVSPVLIDCSALCKEYASAYIELDTLQKRVHRLSRFLHDLSPDGRAILEQSRW